jgi:hypothetical protein
VGALLRHIAWIALRTLIRFLTSVVHVPVMRSFSPQQDPEDLDTCMAAPSRD